MSSLGFIEAPYLSISAHVIARPHAELVALLPK
jgi:hypothetical protein